MNRSNNADVIVIGAGIVGAACAYYLTLAGLAVTVLERGTVASGTTSHGEGNILVSDKLPGPELDLALRSVALWRELGERFGDSIELESKGGLIVTHNANGTRALAQLAARQRRLGVKALSVQVGDLPELEPMMSDQLDGGVFYPQDMQVQPMLAAAQLLAGARRAGAKIQFGRRALGIELRGAEVRAVRTAGGPLATQAVVNAAGVWSPEIANLAGSRLPVRPRRGFVLVTEPVGRIVRHKVYDADYVENVLSDDIGLQTSTVVESTAAGTILIGASREQAGFERTLELPVLARLAQQAVLLFPALASVRAIRAYSGFRPFSPDHLPIIGADPSVIGLYHACGHEGAGIGLAPATGALVASLLTDSEPTAWAAPFAPSRFAAGD